MNVKIVHELEFDTDQPLTLDDLNAIVTVAERQGFDRQARVIIVSGDVREHFYRFKVCVAGPEISRATPEEARA